ncbi:hypothetical protein Droror1_Dr00005015 [Drosera rotundifolia]
MPKCFSVIRLLDKLFSTVFTHSGLRHAATDLGDGTMMHCWVPTRPVPSKPNLVLLHGFGANTKWQWSKTICKLVPHFNVYVPDLVFFGRSTTTRPDRTDAFQAECVMRVLEAHHVKKVSAAVGLSYGGYVAYSMAATYGPEVVERVVICCCGVVVEEKDLREGVFVVGEVDLAAEVLTPQTPEKMMEMLGYVAYKKPSSVPTCLLNDFIDVFCREYVDERRELLQAILKDRKISELPKIKQPTLILWGDEDKVFPIELAHRLKRHLGDTAQLTIIEKAGHLFSSERSDEFNKHLKAFLIGHPPAKSVGNTPLPVDGKVETNGAFAVSSETKTTVEESTETNTTV